MAKYSYNELKVAAADGRRIGAYMGKNVFVCSKWKYDADNKIVKIYIEEQQ